jgi:signal transduction histidine kinase
VSDDGDGIETDDLSQVFERFSRRERDRARRSGGTGLGLAIVKAIVDAHDGSVEVESSRGAGTTFRIQLRVPRHDRRRDPSRPMSHGVMHVLPTA